jgi:hypothetical protein
MLYVIPVPVGAVTVIVPVATARWLQSCSRSWCSGVAGCVLIVTLVGAEIHPAAFLTVTE